MKMKQNTLTDARVIKTRNCIKAALVELLSEKKLRDITVSELAQRADINRKTFYRHFDCVQDVVGALEQDLIEDLLVIAREDDVSCLNLDSVLRQIGALIEKNRAYLTRVTRLNPSLFSYGRLNELLRRTIRSTLRRSAKIESPEELAYIVDFTVAGVLAVISEWFRGGCRDDLNMVVRTAERMTAHGYRDYFS